LKHPTPNNKLPNSILPTIKMHRPYPFTRPSPSFQERYNPIYDETEAKKADARQKSNPFLPFSLFSSPSQPDHIHESGTQPPRQPSSPPLCSGGAAPPSEYPTFTAATTTTCYSNHSSHSVDSNSPFNEKPPLPPRKKADPSRSRSYSRSEKSQTRREQKAREKENAAREKEKKEREKEREKERQRQRKRNSGLGWAKSWSFGGERFGGTVLADAGGVRVPIFRFRICGWGCSAD
jgi:DNA polymerase sigma